jgi:membrane-associated phospholipid phosphatase
MVVLVVVANYVSLRGLLPLLRPGSVDPKLARLDALLFGAAPAQLLERFNVRAVVEWFSFFYLGYFALCLAYTLAFLWVVRSDRARSEFAVGTALLYCVGQLGYVLVPAFGPVAYLAESFQHPVAGGLFWSWVTALVAAGGALKDVFPSMHTAGPIWFAVCAWRIARTDTRWRARAFLTSVAAANVAIATVLLRWHYGVDVIAGAALAAVVALAAPRIVRAESRARAALGVRGVWDFRFSRPDDRA